MRCGAEVSDIVDRDTPCSVPRQQQSLQGVCLECHHTLLLTLCQREPTYTNHYNNINFIRLLDSPNGSLEGLNMSQKRATPPSLETSVADPFWWPLSLDLKKSSWFTGTWCKWTLQRQPHNIKTQCIWGIMMYSWWCMMLYDAVWCCMMMYDDVWWGWTHELDLIL